jgi:hypothetical protein
MPARASFDYAIVRVVPRVEIVFCRTRGFLEARIALDTVRLAALAPDLDLTSRPPANPTKPSSVITPK